VAVMSNGNGSSLTFQGEADLKTRQLIDKHRHEIASAGT
jgi:hypothetical protein